MRKAIGTVLFVGLLVVATAAPASAQNCKSMAKWMTDIADDIEPELIAAGCKVRALFSPGAAPTNGEMIEKCIEAGTEAAAIIRAFVKAYNDSTNNWGEAGPRELEFDETLEGRLIGTSGRMYISVYPMLSDSITVKVRERDGKAKTSVTLCTFESDDDWDKAATRWFNDSKRDKKNRSETREVQLNGVMGRWVSVHLDAKSATNAFAYDISAEELPESEPRVPTTSSSRVPTTSSSRE